jgi:hypothetical protein
LTRYDALILLEQPENVEKVVEMLVPGGWLVVRDDSDVLLKSAAEAAWDSWSPSVSIQENVIARQKWIRVQKETCPWIEANIQQEQERVHQATVALSSAEMESQELTAHSIQAAVQKLHRYGFCILPQWVRQSVAQKYAEVVLQDLDLARSNLLEKGVDIFKQANVSTFRELSMREDYRMDIREGPQLQRMTEPLFPSQLETLLQHAMHPMNDLARGNYGRYNFQDIGPHSYPAVRIGKVGGIVSLPGAADQAIHADTPHLFLQNMPPHYINVFTPGFCDTPGCGQTAFLPSSHRLEVSARYTDDQDLRELVRPRLQLGDVLLFDCRILHFGLADTSQVKRPLLYVNTTLHWFVDPKNWNDQDSVFK